jgi:hypothetical protein
MKMNMMSSQSNQLIKHSRMKRVKLVSWKMKVLLKIKKVKNLGWEVKFKDKVLKIVLLNRMLMLKDQVSLIQ